MCFSMPLGYEVRIWKFDHVWFTLVFNLCIDISIFCWCGLSISVQGAEIISTALSQPTTKESLFAVTLLSGSYIEHWDYSTMAEASPRTETSTDDTDENLMASIFLFLFPRRSLVHYLRYLAWTLIVFFYCMKWRTA